MKKYNVGFISGFFDILHEGHIHILEQAKSCCNQLIVAVGTDEFMRIRKGREPVLSYNERVQIVRAIKYVDMVVAENRESIHKVIEKAVIDAVLGLVREKEKQKEESGHDEQKPD